MEEKKQEEKIEFKIKDLYFKLDIREIKTGQFISYEIEKQNMSANQLNNIQNTISTSAIEATYIIEMMAFFRTIAPEVSDKFSIDVANLNMFDTSKIVSEFVKVVRPWFLYWVNEFAKMSLEGIEDSSESD